MMTIFTMFFIELMASRYQIFGDHSHGDVEASDPTKDMLRYSDKKPAHDRKYLLRISMNSRKLARLSGGHKPMVFS